jgi:ABC-type branched-subunit amino acid transport system substrate-binding protein
LALLSGCGNRLSYERLRADAVGAAVTQAPPAVQQPVAGAAPAAARPASSAAAPAAATAAAQVPIMTGGGTAAKAPVAGHASSATANRTAAAAPATPAGAAEVSSAKSSAAPGSASCGRSLTPIKIGSVGENSGVAGAAFGPGAKALQAWTQWTNARGGLACHPVQLFVGDDAGDPATNQSLVQSFVEQKGVVAFVYMDAPFAGAASVKYLNEHRIPVIGSEGGSEWFNENPTFFPQMATGAQYVEGAFAMAGATLVPKGQTKLASFTCVEAPVCSSAYAIADKLATKYGMTLVYRGQVTITQPNYTSSCLQAKNAGAQIVFLGYDGNSDQRTARSCASVGFHPKFITPAVGLTPAQASAPELAGLQADMPVIPWFEAGNSAIGDFLGALSKFAPGVEPSAVGVEAWVAAEVFGFAASHVSDKPTSADILQGIFNVKKNDFGGLTQALTYTEGAANQKQRLCWWAAQFNGTKVSSPNGGKETCQ